MGTDPHHASDFSSIEGEDDELSQEEINNAIESGDHDGDGLVDALDDDTEQTVKDDALQTYNEYMECIDGGLDSSCDDQKEAWDQAKETLREINIDNPEETISNMDDAYDVGFW